MSHKALRIAVSVVVIGGALTYLMAMTVSENAAYYLHVNEIADSQADWYGKRMSLHGYVQKGSIETNPKTLAWRFNVESEGKVIRATYTGVVPDTFKDDAEVVIKGRLTPAGFEVEKDGVSAKCPSKYEAAQSPVGR